MLQTRKRECALEFLATSLEETPVSVRQSDDSDITALFSLRSRKRLGEVLGKGSIVASKKVKWKSDQTGQSLAVSGYRGKGDVIFHL